jgi:intracellular septation protein A
VRAAAEPEADDYTACRPMLVARVTPVAGTDTCHVHAAPEVHTPDSGETCGCQTVSHRPMLLAVARRSLPQIVEATLIPSLLFYVIVTTIGAGAAMVAVLVWTYVAVLRRVVRGRRPSAILILATIGLTVRTLVGLVSGSTFAYFIQPVATTLVLAAVFLGSVLFGRPLIARMANDFCPVDPEVSARPAVIRLFAGLTVLWGVVHLLTAAATFGMLVSMPVAPFVALKTITCIAITALAVVVTVTWSVRIARSENLVFAGPLT